MLDLTKPVQTRDGRSVRIFCTDGGGDMPVLGAIGAYPKGHWDLRRWSAKGFIRPPGYGADNDDLMNIPETFEQELWLNVYKKAPGSLREWGTAFHYNREDADRSAGNDRVACVHVVIKGEVGEGL